MWKVLNDIGPSLALAVLIGTPLGLAWWLSDGFAGFLSWPSGAIRVGVTVNPHTNRTCTAVINTKTGAPVAYGE
jgi:hypothetical protein